MSTPNAATDEDRAFLLSPAATQVIIGVNPTAGKGKAERHIRSATQWLNEHGCQVTVETNLNSLVEQARQAFDTGQLRAVMAAGGDGTAAELINRLPAGVPVALLPLGTENLLAKYLGVPTLHTAVAAIARGVVVRLDAGRANGRIFMLHVGVGFDADVVRRLHAARDGNIHHWSYAKPIWDSIRNYSYPPLNIQIDGDSPNSVSREISARWAFIFNLPAYASGLTFTPRAVGVDGQLDLCAFAKGSFRDGMWYLYNVIRQQHDRLPDCTMTQAARFHIESQQPTPYQLDGDPGGMLPVDIEVIPRRLTLVAPAAWVAAHKLHPQSTLV